MRSERTRTCALLPGVAAAVLLLGACGDAVSTGGPVSAASASSGASVPAGTAASSPGDEPTLAPGTRPAPAPTPVPAEAACRTPGASTGPAAPVASLHLALPASGTAGSTLAAVTTVVVRSDAPRVVLRPSASALVVLRDGAVVGSTSGRGAGDVPLPLRGGATLPAQVVPEALPLIGCDGAPLPPGRYTVVALAGYGEDALNAGADGGPGLFQLVSPAVPLTVT